MTGNPYPPCRECHVRHNPDHECAVNPAAGDGVIHTAPFLKKYGG